MVSGDHGWIGRGRARVARRDGRLYFEIDGVATRTGPARKAVAELCRKEYRGLGPTFEPFAVSIWIEAPWTDPARRKKIDADNVAKACLDALSGIVWRDDSQVQRLVVEKVEADQPRILIEIGPHRAGANGSPDDIRDGLREAASTSIRRPDPTG
ncbi:MAG: RusA family crossover junction endodeoxyribonuclease [Alphaproteobacteria bacterium]|nr:RusA family crossover junction endodeoxyribonuclease [Alphaproteobacteria bacterium]